MITTATPLRVILFASPALDPATLEPPLQRAGYQPQWQRANDIPALLALIGPTPTTVILAHCASPSALALQNRALEWPLIILADPDQENEALTWLRLGAADYTRTDTLAHLGITIQHALQRQDLQVQTRVAEQARRENQAHLQMIMDYAPLVLFSVDSAGRFTLSEGRGLQRLGLQPGQVLGQSAFDVLADFPLIQQHIRRALAGETHTQRVELGPSVFETQYVALHDELGIVRGAAGVAVDITSHHHAVRVQAALYRIAQATLTTASLDDLYRAIHHSIAELMPARNLYIALYDATRQTLTFPYYEDEYDEGRTHTPLPLGHGLTEYVLRTNQPLLVTRALFNNLVAQGEVEAIGADSVDWIGVPLRAQVGIMGVLAVQIYQEQTRLTEADKEILMFVSTQVAMAIERKHTETRLRESEERFRALAENIPGVIYLCYNDTEYTYLYLNDRVEQLLGYTKDEFLQHRIRITELYHPDDLARVRSEVNQAVVAGKPFHLIYRMRHRSGEWRWLEDWGASVQLPGLTEMVLEGFFRDITELRQAEAAMRHTQKLESLGVLAGGIAHDFNNLLVAMLGQTSLALGHLPTDHPARPNIEKAVYAAERAADLTRQMLAYSGSGALSIQPLQVNQLIQDSVGLLALSLPKSVMLETDLAPGLPLIDADAGQLQQVIMNLIINAAEAIGPQVGHVHLQTQPYTLFPADSTFSLYTGEALSPGPYVLLAVDDNGSGMDNAMVGQIFDPFFTTKFTGRGLGLAAVLGIVRGHRGGLQVETTLGQGTTFRLIFPISQTLELLPPVTFQPREITPALAAPPLILLIDDEAPVREVVTDILALEGFQVITAANGQAGLELYQQHMPHVQLVILDLSMPGLSGEETFRALQQLDPHVRILISSGYSQSEMTRRFGSPMVAGFLQKPYDADVLALEVWRLLQSA